MNLRYSKYFKIPRKIIKLILSVLYPLVIKIWPLPKVKSIETTIDAIFENRFSICRFGDSEFLYIVDRIDLPYQDQNSELRERLISIIKSDNPNILIGLPIGYYSLRNLKKETRIMWRSQITWIYPRLRKYLDLNKSYYNASMTRLYMDYEDTSNSTFLFMKVKKLWEDREILLIEGEKSRLGVGNDLFSNAISVQRLLGPAHNAFKRFRDILEESKKQPKEKLILVAMGPTAKVLVYELACSGYQAIDIGNLDIEYEWYIRKLTKKIKIPGKYTSEASGGRIVDDLGNSEYTKQIINSFL